MLPFHIRLERLKLIFYGFILNFFINITLKLLQFAFFLSSHVFTASEFDSNYFGTLL